MSAELTHHLGYEKHGAAPAGSGNARNGTSRKKLQGDFGEVEIDVPRDCDGSFEPRLCPSIKGALRASTTRYFGCTRGVYRPGRSKRPYKKSMESK